jgi:predicted transcriptional regulator
MDKKNKKHRIMAMLIDNPRMMLTEISRETGMPISTVFETIKRIQEEYELKAFFVRRCAE